MKKLILLLVALLLSVSCSDNTFKKDKVFAGGVYVKAATMNHGKMVYMEYCMACHGAAGDGNGIAAKGLIPPPRDLTLGVYKFGRVLAGELPHDEDFKLILLKGLHGTAMLPWDLTPQQLNSVIQYIKTFAPDIWVGKDKTLGEQIKPTKDPFGLAHRTAAIERGKEVYHGVAQCQSCHRAYVTPKEMDKISKKINEEAYEYEEDDYKIKLQESEYEVKQWPPDFTWHEIRSAQSVEELYVRIAAGVGGTGMPSWQGTIEDEDIWAVSHYVKYLMDMKDKPERNGFIAKLNKK